MPNQHVNKHATLCLAVFELRKSERKMVRSITVCIIRACHRSVYLLSLSASPEPLLSIIQYSHLRKSDKISSYKAKRRNNGVRLGIKMVTTEMLGKMRAAIDLTLTFAYNSSEGVNGCVGCRPI